MFLIIMTKKKYIQDMLEIQELVTEYLKEQPETKFYIESTGLIGIELLYLMLNSTTDDINELKSVPIFLTYSHCTKEQEDKLKTHSLISEKDNEIERMNPSIYSMIPYDFNNNNNEGLSRCFWLCVHERYSYLNASKESDTEDEE